MQPFLYWFPVLLSGSPVSLKKNLLYVITTVLASYCRHIHQELHIKETHTQKNPRRLSWKQTQYICKLELFPNKTLLVNNTNPSLWKN